MGPEAECVCAVDPLWLDLLWSLVGLVIGMVLGYLLRDKKEKLKK